MPKESGWASANRRALSKPVPRDSNPWPKMCSVMHPSLQLKQSGAQEAWASEFLISLFQKQQQQQKTLNPKQNLKN